MPELLSPGVFIQEAADTVQVVGPVSTSNMGLVSWTSKGPANDATLVTSFEQYTKTFGSFDRRSFGAYAAAAFFANGGRRLFQVRVVPDDATTGAGTITSQTTDQAIESGDGIVVAFTKTATTSALKDNSGASPIVPGSLTIRWRGKAAAQTDVATKKRDGTTTLQTATGVLVYEGRLVTGLPTLDAHMLSVVPDGTTVIKWLSGAVTKSVTVAAPTGGSTISTATNGAGSSVRLDFRTGIFSLIIVVAETPDNAADVTATYSPATASYTVTDDGAGVLPAGSVLTGPGTIDYATGAYSFTTNATVHIPHIGSSILATYQIKAWTWAPQSPGLWGNNLKIRTTGSLSTFTASTQTYSKYNVQVIETDSDGNDVVKETYEDLDLSDPTAQSYFADVLNAFSKYVIISVPAGDEPPGQLNGVTFTRVLAGGDDSDSGRLITATLPSAGLPIGKRSVTITYTDSSGTARTIQDDGKGVLTGDIDTSYTGGTANTVNYTTGALDFKTKAVAGPLGIDAGTLVSVTWSQAPAATAVSESATGGADGTFDSTNFGSAQHTGAALAADYLGIYALDRIDEIMSVVVPDFAGDTVATGEMLDYAESRANSPSGGDRFMILAVPKGSSAEDAVDWFRNQLGRFSKYAALYWPWVRVSDPLSNGRILTIPPVGHIGGVYARVDNNRNVGKSPGGTIDGQLNFLIGLEIKPTQGERDLVYPNRINPLISSPQTGIAVWGVRTISQDTTWKYINARRLFMFLEKSVFNSIFWTVFENNGPALWARVKGQLDGFLMSLFNDGYFAGTTPSQAFYVICDDTNNPPESVNQGVLNVKVGAAVGKPAEFVVITFSQKTSSS